MVRIVLKRCFLWTSKLNLPIILFALIFVSLAVYFSVYATSDLVTENSNNDYQQMISEYQSTSLRKSINNSDITNITSSSFNTPLEGILQIPYTGLVTESMSPAIAEILDLESTTRGKMVTHVIPGSPAERTGMQAMNTTIPSNIKGITTSGGDIILIVDGGTTFATDYDSLEDYIQENKKVGESITLTILRDGQVKDIEMTIGAMPRFLWYENTNVGIKMKYPSDWSVAYRGSTVGKEFVKFHSTEKIAKDQVPVATVSIVRYLSNSTDAPNTFKSGEKNEINNIRILKTNLTSVDKSPAYVSIYYDYSQKNHTLKVLTVFAVRDEQVYRIDFSADPPKYDDYLPLATEMIGSFQFT
jgi:hypothetical protein